MRHRYGMYITCVVNMYDVCVRIKMMYVRYITLFLAKWMNM